MRLKNQRGFLLNPFRFGSNSGFVESIMAANPWLYYRFPSTSSGTVCPDSSGGGHYADFGTHSNYTFTPTTTKPTDSSLLLNADASDRALQSSLKVQGTYADMPTGTGSFTIQAIVKPTSAPPNGNRGHVVGVSKGVGGSPILAMYPNNAYTAFVPAVENYYVATPIVSSVTVAFGEKAILHLRYTTGTNLNELFLNGVLVGSATQAWAVLSSGEKVLRVGHAKHPLSAYDSSDGNPFNGTIDEVAVFQYALTNTQITSIMTAWSKYNNPSVTGNTFDSYFNPIPASNTGNQFDIYFS